MATSALPPRKKRQLDTSRSESEVVVLDVRETAKTSVASQAEQSDKTQKAFAARDEALRSILTCKICFRMLYEPYTLCCGHTYCYSCLCQWFGSSERHLKTCPDCRSAVETEPAPAYALREVTRELVQREELLPQGESSSQHAECQKEEAAIVEKDKWSADPGDGGLFKGVFRRRNPLARVRPFFDEQDGVIRCPDCDWELEGDTLYCAHCHHEFAADTQDSLSGDTADSWDSESSLELDGDLNFHDQDFNNSMQSHAHNWGYLTHTSSGSPVSSGPIYRFMEHSRRLNHPRSDVSYDDDAAVVEMVRHGSYDQGDNEEDEDEDEDDASSSMDGFVVNDDVVEGASESGESDDSSSTTRQAQQLSTSRPNTSRRARYVITDSDDETTTSDTHEDSIDEVANARPSSATYSSSGVYETCRESSDAADSNPSSSGEESDVETVCTSTDQSDSGASVEPSARRGNRTSSTTSNSSSNDDVIIRSGQRRQRRPRA